MLKILQARLQQYVGHKLPDVQAGFRKGRGTRDQIASICWIIEKVRKIQKNINLCFNDYAKAFDCVDHSKMWKILQDMGIPDHLTCLPRCSDASVCKSRSNVRTNHGTTDWFQIGKKEYVKAVYCHPAYLTSTQSTSCEMPGWMKHKLESRVPRKISITSVMQMTLPLWQKAKRN